MKELGITPGPWKVGGTGIFPSVMDAAGFAIVATGMSKRHISECRANARLIAAAPELYEAAERALNYIENTEGEFGIKLESGDMLRAAIARPR